MLVKDFLESIKGNGLAKEIATDYSQEKKAYAQAVDILKQLEPGDKVKELYDLYSAADAVRQMAGLFPDYLNRRVNTSGYYDKYLAGK